MKVRWATTTKGTDWSILQDTEGLYPPDQAQSVLMDIRGELQNLNRLLHCHNFADIPRMLIQIKRNTAKPKRKKKETHG